MDLRNLSDKALEKLKKKQEILEVLRNYQGVDRVVKIEEALEEIKKLPERVRVDCKLPTVNKHLDGFRCGELVVVSGPTGHGKSTLLQSFTYDFNEKKTNCLWFSYEVGVRDLVKRFEIDMPSFSLPLKTVESNFKWMRQRIWESIAKFDTKVVFIDHLHYLLDMNYLAKVNTSLAIGMLMRDLKKLAVETDTLIFLVSHLSKTKLEEEPDLDDIRDSSFIGQESDIVLVIYREKIGGDYGRSWVKVAKNRRNGTVGSIPVVMRKGGFYEESSVDSSR
jgi:replicative DNA helicase